MREYLVKTTGFSRAQVTRLIARYRETGRIEDRRGGNSGRPFARVYTPADIRLLAEADEIGGQLCGPAACEVLRREFEVFGDRRYERLSRLSASHLYNLRRTKTHRARPATVGIGERRRPDPGGKPGVTFGGLDKTAHAMSDLHANRLANRARDELFRAIGRAVNAAA